jgi:hypothetical protein
MAKAAPSPVAGYVLDPELQAALEAHCRVAREDPAAFVADAIAAMLDQMGELFAEETAEAIIEAIAATGPSGGFELQ